MENRNNEKENISMGEENGGKKSESAEKENADTIKVSGRLVLGIMIGIVIAVIAFGVIQRGDKSITGDVVKTEGGIIPTDGDVAAIVNGESITVGELNKAFDRLPSQYAGTVTKDSLLNQIIQSKIFYQEAEKQGLVLSDEEARQQFDEVKLSSGLTEEQFSASLAAQGTTEKELIDQYKKQLAIQKFINVNLLDKIEISDEEIREYYTENIAQFKTGEQVVVRHILIGDVNLSTEEKTNKAKELLDEINEKNFCEYVNDYSTDVASVPTCGEYTFSMTDPLVEEFKRLSFEQKEGEIGTVETQFGTHIIWTVEKIPGKTISLEEASEKIGEFLKTKKGQEQYNGFYENISKDSMIEIKYSEL